MCIYIYTHVTKTINKIVEIIILILETKQIKAKVFFYYYYCFISHITEYIGYVVYYSNAIPSAHLLIFMLSYWLCTDSFYLRLKNIEHFVVHIGGFLSAPLFLQKCHASAVMSCAQVMWRSRCKWRRSIHYSDGGMWLAAAHLWYSHECLFFLSPECVFCGSRESWIW